VEVYGVDAIERMLEDLIAVGEHGLRNTDFSGEPSPIHATGAVPLPDEKGSNSIDEIHMLFDGLEEKETDLKLREDASKASSPDPTIEINPTAGWKDGRRHCSEDFDAESEIS